MLTGTIKRITSYAFVSALFGCGARSGPASGLSAQSGENASDPLVQCQGGSVRGCQEAVADCAEREDIPCLTAALGKGCELGSMVLCEHLKGLCGIAENAECLFEVTRFQCMSGDARACELMAVAMREAFKECGTEAACDAAKRLALELDRVMPSPENTELYMTSVDRLCHQFHRADQCIEIAEFFRRHAYPEEKVLEHVILGCRNGHQPTCAALGAMRRLVECVARNDGGACYSVAAEIYPTNPSAAGQVFRWACTERKHKPSCKACSEIGLDCKVREARELPRPLRI